MRCADYRSATISGTVTQLRGADRDEALVAFAEFLFPGRSAEVRPSKAKELAATAVCALPIVKGEWLYKARTHGVGEPIEPTTAWTGVIPIRRVLGTPRPSLGCDAPLPDSLRALLG